MIRAKDEEIELSQYLLINLSFYSDELPQFANLTSVEPLRCNAKDLDWTLQLPSVLHHEIQETKVTLISENDQFYYDEELNTVKTLDGLNYTSYCNSTEVTLVFMLKSNLLGSNE